MFKFCGFSPRSGRSKKICFTRAQIKFCYFKPTT